MSLRSFFYIQKRNFNSWGWKNQKRKGQGDWGEASFAKYPLLSHRQQVALSINLSEYSVNIISTPDLSGLSVQGVKIFIFHSNSKTSKMSCCLLSFNRKSAPWFCANARTKVRQHCLCALLWNCYQIQQQKSFSHVVCPPKWPSRFLW